jgi:phenylalanyl-tRNA synthetase beta chain
MFKFLSKFFSSKPKTVDAGVIQTAEVLAIEPHPNADRLVQVRVKTLEGELFPVVCGAKNFQVGDIVVLALPGAQIAQNIHSEAHEPFVLEKAKIRGVESQGMLCALFELGLASEPGDGIVVLPPGTPVGVNALKILKPA